MAYSLGVDYGTQSGRVLLLDLQDGRELAVAVVPYAHGVIDETLPGTGERLPPDWALQHPVDYLTVLQIGIPEALAKAGIDPQQVVGIGIDFTSCTVLPVDATGVPLCFLANYAERRHAWPKLWKHHAAQPIADRINALASERGESFLSRYGGRVSSEWYFPKLLEVFAEDRTVYDACHRFIEATDWVVWQLTGKECRNSCTAGYKALWSEEEGLPDADFFAQVQEGFTDPYAKLGRDFYPLGARAGNLCADFASALGLSTAVAVAVGNVDAMVSAPAVGVSAPGALVMVMGTSICHLTLTDQEIRLPGVTGVVKDGILPGYYGYEAGQAAVGDMFEWFISTQVPQSYFTQAEARGLTIYQWLEQRAAQLMPGQHGLLVLDWFNGNRSILGDADLSGVMVGLTLATTVEDIYRALLEATAFGTRRIVENFHAHGIVISELVACGGLPHKSPLLMQLYADICGLPVTLRASQEIPARGAAMFGAVAAGAAMGGFASIRAASEQIAAPLLEAIQPNADATQQYDEIYTLYREMYTHFGQAQAKFMHDLKAIRLKVNAVSVVDLKPMEDR